VNRCAVTSLLGSYRYDIASERDVRFKIMCAFGSRSERTRRVDALISRSSSWNEVATGVFKVSV
jgi:hypothetical protein